MQASDLFIGAWVMPVSYGIPCPNMQVVGLTPSTVSCVVDAEQGDPYEYDVPDIFPITLTHDVVLKNGFVRQATGVYKLGTGFGHVEGRTIDYGGLWEFTVYKKSRSRIKFRLLCSKVHQFQKLLLGMNRPFVYNR